MHTLGRQPRIHLTAVGRSFKFAVGHCKELGPVGAQSPPGVKQPQNQTLERPPPCCLPLSPLWESSVARNKEQVPPPPTAHVRACVHTHTYAHSASVFPRGKGIKITSHLPGRTSQNLMEGRIPSTPERSERSWSHLRSPVFPAAGNSPSFYVGKEMYLEAVCPTYLAGSPGACHLTSLIHNIFSEKWMLISGLP